MAAPAIKGIIFEWDDGCRRELFPQFANKRADGPPIIVPRIVIARDAIERSFVFSEQQSVETDPAKEYLETTTTQRDREKESAPRNE